MKKPTFSKFVLVVLLLLMGLSVHAQNYVPFVPRYDEAIKGDMLLIGNSNLGTHKINPYNGTDNNESGTYRSKMVYVDIDNDGTTFNSSSADLIVPSDTNCYQVVYAALYWTSTVAGDTPMESIKFKTPASDSYIDITGTQIYYQNSSDKKQSDAYVYYKDVTDIVAALGDADGTYTVGNISAMTSQKMKPNYNQEGLSAGWSLFVIYEDPLLPSKYITSFDGFTKIFNKAPDNKQDFLVDGFKTIPVGPVRAKYAFSALEGDFGWKGDYLEINGTKIGANDINGKAIRPTDNFFNSSVSIIDPHTNAPMPFVDRNPTSTNTLGFDAGIISIPNVGNKIIGNGDTSAKIKLGTNVDIYYFYFNAFAIEIIAPKIVLTKIVEDVSGNNIGGQLVNLGDELNYVIGFQNVGNDDATNLIIRDVLPQNIDFNYPEDIALLPTGVTVQSYNSQTRELIFKVDNTVVEINDPVKEIRFKVTVVKECSLLNDACSNVINNQAYATYQGTDNPNFTISDDPSYKTNSGCILTPGATNFLADITCSFEETVILCGTSVKLTAGNGYDSYSWSTSPTGSPVIGTGQSIVVKNIGTYYVHNTATAPCQSIDQSFEVITYGENSINPILPFADEVVICPNDGKKMPNLYLCGVNDARFLQTNITDTSSIIWEKLVEGSCSASSLKNCANEESSCEWTKVGTGPNYKASLAGQYRITLNYEGGCFSQYYFNVYSNELIPTATSKDILCDTPGEIVVGGVPSGYEYSIDGANYQASNIFKITTPNVYSVYVKQTGAFINPCIFSVPDVQIRARNFSGSAVVTQPLCYNEKGSVKLAANDVLPQYFYTLSKGATEIHKIGPVMDSDYTFSNLSPGNYSATISTEDGCTETVTFKIVNPPLLTATLAITAPLTCTDGEITVYPKGGTPPYYYFVNGATEFQSNPEIVVSAPGVYDVLIMDSNNCSIERSITVDQIPAPNFTVAKTDILCAEDASGKIKVNVSNANGNSLRYSINGGETFVKSSVFSGLDVGDYQVVVEFTAGNTVCLSETKTVSITSAAPIVGTATLSTPLTCIADGTITVSNVSGGKAPYAYSIDGINFQPSNTFSNLKKGTYNITIKDDSNCMMATNSITLDALEPPTDLSFSHTALTCPANTTSITVTETIGGKGNLEYRIIAPAAAVTSYQTSTTFVGLVPRTYTIQVKDENDCIYKESYTVKPLPIIKVVGQPMNDVTCFAAADGSARFTVSGTTKFKYSVNGGTSKAGSSPIVLTGLADGTHTVVITDNKTNCEASASVTIASPTTVLGITTTTTPITCLVDGSVIIKANGGWGGNSYRLTLPDGTVLPSQNTGTFSNLIQEGVYTASVTDAKGCVVRDTFTLTTPDAVIATIQTTSDFCYDTTTGASLKVAVSAGKAPFEYRLNGSAFQKNNSFKNLVPGTYNITVRDAFGCEYSLPSEIIAPQLGLTTLLTKDLDCTIHPEGVISGKILGGYGPFTYAVAFNGGTFTALGTTGSTFTYHATTAGNYRIRVTDAQGCSAESGVTLDPISDPAFSIVAQTQQILCHDDDNGTIKITVDPSKGTPPFVIHIFNETTGVDYGSKTSGLTAGTYAVTVTDAKSCTATDQVIIDQPEAMEVKHHAVDITCSTTGVSQGSVIVDKVTGGTPPYNYFVTGTNGYAKSELNNAGTTSVSFDVVDFGLYQIDVVDANGCSVLVQDVLVASPPDDLDIYIEPTFDCATGGEAVVSIGTTLASAGPFFFSIYEGPGSVYPAGIWLPEDTPGSKSATFTGLTPSVLYTFIVYDQSTNCSHYEPSTEPIPSASSLTASLNTVNNISCTGSADGKVSFNIKSGYTSAVNVTYEIFNSLSLTSTGISGSGSVPATGSLLVTELGPLGFGNYYVLISETSGPNAGCGVVTKPFNITESAFALELTAQIDKNANCEANSGQISAVAKNGTGPYLYQITTSATSPLSTDAAWASANTFYRDAGSYYVHVMDAYACIQTIPAALNLNQDPTPVVEATLVNQCDVSEGSFDIQVSLSSAGIAPYSFSINGGAFQTRVAPFTISNLTSGTHTVAVKDANGCGSSASVTIEAPVAITSSITALPTCANDDGVITVTTAGGTDSYNYSISPNAAGVTLSGNVFSNVPSGTYLITVEDAITGCTANQNILLDAASPVIFATEATHVSCQGGSDGSITVVLDTTLNDNPIYTYAITSGPSTVAAQNSNVFKGLTAGTYMVEVNSGRGCIAIEDVTITEPDLLEVSGIANDFVCALDNSTNAATLTITAVGGTAPYMYSIDGSHYFTGNSFESIDNGSIQTITIFVLDANGCEATNTVILDPLPELTAALVTIATPIDCNETGSVTIDVTGGSGNFTYQMLPDGLPQASNMFHMTEPGTYYFQVADVDTGCYIDTVAFTVDPFDEIEVKATATTAVTCFGNTNGALEIDVTNYVGNYTYKVLDSVGIAVIVATNAHTSTNPQVINGLPGGNYTVVVTETDSPFCATVTNVVTIDSPAAPLTLEVAETSNVTCDDSQGTIVAIADGGWGSYEYELTGAASVSFSPNGTFTNLSVGTYTINVKDGGGCVATETITLNIPDPIIADFTPNTTLLSCFGDQDASITVSHVSGGQESNYVYTLNTLLPTISSSGPQTSPVFNNLGAGTYSITITDGYNCSMTSVAIVINQPPMIEADLVAVTTPTCLTEARLTLSATGGTGMYTYSDTSAFTNILGTFASSISFDVAVGTYQYFVRDANGCVATVSNEITIDPLPPLTTNLNLTNAVINCNGDATGVIVATAQGGLGNYVYTLQDGSGNPLANATQITPGIFTDLVAGIYFVKVDSGDCNTTSARVEIAQPLAPLEVTSNVLNVSCYGGNNGSIELHATGGTGVIKYAISPQLNQFFESNVFENLAPGSYDIIVQDELGCYAALNVTITEPAPVVVAIIPTSIYPEICADDNDGEFSISILGGTAPYSVSLDDENGPYITGTSTQTQFDFTGLQGGDHRVFVRDSQGCETEWNITLPESVKIEPIAIVEYVCENNAPGNRVIVEVDKSISDVSELDFSLNGGTYQSSHIFENVVAGVSHYIEVRHSNGCIKRTALFDINNVDVLQLALNDGGLNEIVATAAGGTGGYQFTLNGEKFGSTNSFIISQSGDYTVTVTDSSGCVATATRYFEFIDICIPNYFTPNGDNNFDTWAPGCAINYPNLEFKIFDRYGREVGTYRQGQAWDGKYRNKELPTGDYWYIVKLNNGKDDRDFVGHFTLYR